MMTGNRMLEGRYALITGGTRGIGHAMARIMAEQGGNVAVTSRNREDSQQVAGRIEEELEVRALGARCDVSSRREVEELFAEVASWSGNRLDILVCNAGYPFDETIWNTPLHATPAEKLESWYLDIFRTDVLGSVFCTFAALPLMMATRAGNIIYISSTPALEGYQGSPYTVAKAAILGLMKDVAYEYGKHGIRANALVLGNIKTPATYDHLDADTRQAAAEATPLKRWGMPEEVGKAALFLASDMSSFVTGQTLVVDGGTVRF